MFVAMRAYLLLLVLLAGGGCRVVDPQVAGKSPLAPLSVSPDTIALEVYSAPATPDDPEFADLWELVDEQPLPGELRRQLAANGLRAGLVGPDIPAPLAAVLNVTDRHVEEEDRQLVSMDPEGGVILRVLHAQAGKRIELAVPEVRDEMTLLEAIGNGGHGKTYKQAECRIALRAFPQSDGRVRLQLTPELHYGQFKSHVRGNDGVLMWTQEREKKVFSDLKLEPELIAGQMLLVTRQPAKPLTAGWHFFTNATGDKPQAILWVFRVARAAPDSAFYDGPPDEEASAITNDQQAP
jgi:hypothetical protein